MLACGLPIIFLLILSINANPCFAAQSNYPFIIETEKMTNSHRLVARNMGAGPVSVKVSLLEQNRILSDRSFPLYIVVPPRSRAFELAQIRPSTPGQSYSFKTHYQWQLGNTQAEHDKDTRYRLPFRDGASFRISQAPGGKISTHNTADSQYAVDIPMPEGTPILAARAGTVIYTKSLQTSGGQTPDMLDKANEVRILHSDGTMAVYAHLAHSSIRVFPGERIVSGQQIGQAGSTGYSSGPHLHLAVQTVRREGGKLVTISLPFNFYVGNPAVVFAPRTGMLIRADYTHPGKPPTIGETSKLAPPRP